MMPGLRQRYLFGADITIPNCFVLKKKLLMSPVHHWFDNCICRASPGVGEESEWI